MPNANSFSNTLGNSFQDNLSGGGVSADAFRSNFDNHVRGDKFDKSSYGDPFKSKNIGGHGTKTNKGGAYSETTTVSSSSGDWEKGFDNDSGKQSKKKSKFIDDDHKTAYKRARKYIRNNLKGSERKAAMKQFKKRSRDIDWSDNSDGMIFHSKVDPKTGKPVVSGGANDTPWSFLEDAKNYVMDSKVNQGAKRVKPSDVGMDSRRPVSTKAAAKLGKYGILNELAGQLVSNYVEPVLSNAVESGVKATAQFAKDPNKYRQQAPGAGISHHGGY